MRPGYVLYRALVLPYFSCWLVMSYKYLYAYHMMCAYCVVLNIHLVQGFAEASGESSSSSPYPPPLILILSKLVHDMERSTISYLVSYGDEKFPPTDEGQIVATPTGEVLVRAKGIAQVCGRKRREEGGKERERESESERD